MAVAEREQSLLRSIWVPLVLTAMLLLIVVIVAAT